MKYVAYGRHSTDKQNERSTADQIFEAKRFGDSKGWTFVRSYADVAVSGYTTFGRDDFATMREDARNRDFDCIVVEDVDRLSRNIGDLAKFHELVEYLGVVIYSLSKGGFVSDMDIGFKGTMSAQFLRDLSQKTKRGLAARIRAGRSAGGISYGYQTTSEIGVLAIDPEEADVVRRIFEMYAGGHSPRQIAGVLNAEGIPGARGGVWNASTINGSRQRGVGILRNTLYIGRRVWGKTEKIRNPETGRKIIRPQVGNEKLFHEVPNLRIISDSLWEQVQGRMPNRINGKQRTRTDYLLSGLMKCGECGSSYISMGGGKYVKFGCSARRERSTCSNRRLISRSLLDNAVLFAIRDRLLDPQCVDPALAAFKSDLQKRLISIETTKPNIERRLRQIAENRRKLLDLLESGVEASVIRDRLLNLDGEERTLKIKLSQAPEPTKFDPEDALERYRSAVANLLSATTEDNYAYAREVMCAIRDLVDEVVIYPPNDPQGRDVELAGDIEALFRLDGGSPTPPDQTSRSMHDSLGMEAMVPGGGIEPPTRGFSIHCSTPELPGRRGRAGVPAVGCGPPTTGGGGCPAGFPPAATAVPDQWRGGSSSSPGRSVWPPVGGSSVGMR